MTCFTPSPQLADVPPGEQHRGAGVVERVAQLGLGVPLVERDEDHARARHGLVQLEVAVAVRPDHGDPVAGAEPELVQPADQPAAALPRLARR